MKQQKGGRHSTEVAVVLLIQLAQVRFSAFPRFFHIQIYWCRRDLLTAVHCLVCGHWTVHENVEIFYRTHLVLASGKLVLQNNVTTGQFHKTGHCAFLKNDFQLKTFPRKNVFEDQFFTHFKSFIKPKNFFFKDDFFRGVAQLWNHLGRI